MGFVSKRTSNNSESQTFRLSNNYLDSELPTEWNTPSLETLVFSNNEFEGPIPHANSESKNLKILQLKENNLDDVIPDWFPEMKSLQIINLNHNKFAGMIPSNSWEMKCHNHL